MVAVIFCSRISLICVVLAIAQFGCREARAQDKSSSLQPVAKRDGRVGGLYDTNLGPLRLAEKGGKIRGFYAGETAGTLSGKITADKIVFSYREQDNSRGRGFFSISRNGDTLEGYWKGNDGKRGEWSGKRVEPRPGVRWLLVLESEWESTLRMPDYSFGRIVKAFFERVDHVKVRHRRFRSMADIKEAIAQAGLLPEPVILVLAGHGEDDGLLAGNGKISPRELGKAFRLPGHEISLIHFSSCDIFSSSFANQLRKTIGRSAPALSGYGAPVDWAASAVFELLYLELVAAQRILPARAAKIAQEEIKFSASTGRENPLLGLLHFKFLPAGN